ncbi:MAG: hypothetical protein ABSE51_12530 [Terracidiphilus sp.]|jgi:cytoskeletal protein RodZ
MRITTRSLRKHIAGVLVMFMLVLLEEAAAAPRQEIVGQQAQSIPSTQNQSRNSNVRAEKSSPDASRSEGSYPDDPVPSRQQTADQSVQSSALQAGSEQPQDSTQKPVGTAAAPYGKTSGVAASRPAGVLIAPAKQRRARAILIRVGVVVGAGAAIGTVVALSHGSPSRPN